MKWTARNWAEYYNSFTNKQIPDSPLKQQKGLYITILTLLIFLLPFSAFSQLNTGYYLQKGRQLLHYYKYSRAIQTFNTVIEYQPDHAEAYFLRGIAKYNLGDYYGAERDYSHAVRYKSNAAKAYYYRGMTRIQLYNFQGAIEDFNQTLYFIPGQPELYIQRGFAKMRLEKFQAAIGDFNQALDRNTRSPRAYYYRGVSKLNLKDTTASMQDLSRALQIDSTFANAYITRGRIYQQKKDHRKALNDFNQVLKINPNNSKARINRSMVYYHLDSIQQAMKDLDQVVRNQPSNSLAYYNRALLQTRIGAYDEAVEDYNQVLQYNPQNILTYFNRGIVRMQTGEYGKAIRDFTMAIRYYPNFAKAYINRSIARRKLEDYSGARQDRRRAQQITQSYRNNQLERINFADTSENFRRLISLQGSQNLPRHFGNIDESVEPKNIYSLFYQSGNQQNLVNTINQYLREETSNPEISYLDENFVLEVERPENHSAQFFTDQIAAVSDSIDRYPDSARFYLKRALLRVQIKNYNSALEDMAEVKRLQKDHFMVHFIIGNIRNKMVHYIKMMSDDSRIMDIQLDGKLIEEPLSRDVTFHDYQKVIDDYNQSIQLAPRFVYSYYNRANTRIQNKNYEGAINDYNKAIFLDNEFARAYFNRGLTYIYLQQTTKGCIDISKAGELGMDEAYTVIKLYCQ